MWSERLCATAIGTAVKARATRNNQKRFMLFFSPSNCLSQSTPLETHWQRRRERYTAAVLTFRCSIHKSGWRMLRLDNLARQGSRPKPTFLRDCASSVYAGVPGKRHRKRTEVSAISSQNRQPSLYFFTLKFCAVALCFRGK